MNQTLSNASVAIAKLVPDWRGHPKPPILHSEMHLQIDCNRIAQASYARPRQSALLRARVVPHSPTVSHDTIAAGGRQIAAILAVQEGVRGLCTTSVRRRS